ncbi:hypothetical protein SeMB42_g02048 [Synchytrium endobioticum]|uniref:Uncharacterized protein n=1 Tax=Synchytrium endobioticum TaxID=286115 RepID=A0A507D1A7_9FUNG|nr:hypothetical protein SeLEV6574_g03974 [Synchytrium endobioticum]TPX51015.1 hypothetical protein SeMB42_g02048 [Synchytrium endobioticum]
MLLPNQKLPLSFDETHSAPELRAKLFEALHSTGIADKIKAQIRASLIEQLRQRSQLPPSAPSTESSKNGGSLFLRAADSIVVEYLSSRGFDFTMSVFMPECGLTMTNQVLSEREIWKVLHLERPVGALADLKRTIADDEDQTPFLVRLLDGMAHLSEITISNREVQTDPSPVELFDWTARNADREFMKRSNDMAHSHVLVLEERMLRYQQEVDSRMKQDLEEQLKRFKETEMVHMRVQERKRYQEDLAQARAEFERIDLERRSKTLEWEQQERHRLEEREKELERQNMDLRQRLLSESNRVVLAEAAHRNEAELSARELRNEKEALQRRHEEALAQISELQKFKDRYAEKMQDAIAQHKIDLNREHANVLSSVEIEKTKLEAERALLAERARQVDSAAQQVAAAQAEVEGVQNALRQAREKLAEERKERDNANAMLKELQIQIQNQKSSTALEYEIQSLKRQLLESEKTAEKRQDEYQGLLKSLMAPKNEVETELAKARKGEGRWQRECQQLVVKLDMELTRNEDLQQKYEDELLRVKELQREVADLRLLLHQAQSALALDIGRARRGDDDVVAGVSSDSWKVAGYNDVPQPHLSPYLASSQPSRGGYRLPDPLRYVNSSPLSKSLNLPATSPTQHRPMAPSHPPASSNYQPLQLPELGLAFSGRGADPLLDLPELVVKDPVVAKMNTRKDETTTTTSGRASSSDKSSNGASSYKKDRMAKIPVIPKSSDSQIRYDNLIDKATIAAAARVNLRQQQPLQKTTASDTFFEMYTPDTRYNEDEYEYNNDSEKQAGQAQATVQPEVVQKAAELKKAVDDVDELAADPLMQKYLAIVKERREREKALQNSAASPEPGVTKDAPPTVPSDNFKPNSTLPQMSSYNSSSVETSGSADERSRSAAFGAGATNDEVSAPSYDDSESSQW